MLCWGHNSLGGSQSCGQIGVGLTPLPRVWVNPLSAVGLSTLSHQGPSTSPYTLLPELQRSKDIMSRREVTGNCQEQLTETLIVCLLDKHFFLQ